MSDAQSTTPGEIDEQPDTYYDRDTMLRVATTSDRMSRLFLALFAIVGAMIVVLVYWYARGQLSVLQLIIYALTALVPFLLGGFFWVAARVLTEGVYILMDIEDNTRPQKSPGSGKVSSLPASYQK